MGGGILPVSKHNGKLYFLFGKEAFDDSGETGWADFGGGKEPEDNSVFETAVREGAEELNGFLIKPQKWIKGTKMAYAGLRKEKDRASVILYMNSKGNNPKPLP